MSDDQKSLQQIIDFRLEKLNKLREDGVNPYPTKFEPTHFSESIKSNYDSLEGEIEKLQTQKTELETSLASGELTGEEINEISIQLQQRIADIDEKEERWVELSMKLEG